MRDSLPELPDEKAARFTSQYGLSAYDAGVLTASRELADYYEAVVRAVPREPKLAANWVMGELAAALNKESLDIGSGKMPAARLAGLLKRIADQTISGKIAKEVFEAMWAGGESADAIIESQGPEADHRHRRHRAGHRGGDGEEPRRSWPTIAPARTSCSASSSAR